MFTPAIITSNETVIIPKIIILKRRILYDLDRRLVKFFLIRQLFVETFKMVLFTTTKCRTLCMKHLFFLARKVQENFKTTLIKRGLFSEPP